MEQRYRDAINDARAKLSQALLEDIPTLLEQGLRLDALVRDVLRTVAVALLSALYQGLCAYLVEQATARGLTVQSRPLVRFKTLFGEVEVESPYLRSSQSGESARPMKDVLGVEGEQYSETAQRALVDFGSAKSFARAVVSFEEHYLTVRPFFSEFPKFQYIEFSGLIRLANLGGKLTANLPPRL